MGATLARVISEFDVTFQYNHPMDSTSEWAQKFVPGNRESCFYLLITMNMKCGTTFIQQKLIPFHGNVDIEEGLLGSSVITIPLLQSDIMLLKLNSSMGQQPNDTYLMISANATTDTSFNLIDESKRIMADTVDIDMLPVTLLNFTSDATTGEINLTFSDVIHINTARVSSITIQNAIEPTAPDHNFTLSEFVSVTTYDDAYIVVMDPTELAQLKSLLGDINDTYLMLRTSFIDDHNDVDVIVVIDSMQASRVIPDVTPLVLLSYSLNMNNGVLGMNFSDTISTSTFYTTGITIQITGTYNLSTSVTLSDGIITRQSLHPSIIEILLLSNDIKRTLD